MCACTPKLFTVDQLARDIFFSQHTNIIMELLGHQQPPSVQYMYEQLL